MNTVTNLFGHGVNYIKNYIPPSISNFIPSWTKSNIDDDEPFEEDPPEDSEKTSDSVTSDVNPLLMLIINIAFMILYYIFVLLLVSLIANDMIYYHWILRLFTFSFVLYLCYNTSAIVYPITIYYSLLALYNVYRNYSDRPVDPEARKNWIPHLILPRRYAFLPLMTSRGGRFDFLNPFSYFPEGENPEEPKYSNYTFDSKEYKAKLNLLIPGFSELKSQGGFNFDLLLKKFSTYFYELNQSYLKPADKEGLSEAEKAGQEKREREAIKQEIKGAILATTGPKESDKYVQKAFAPS